MLEVEGNISMKKYVSLLVAMLIAFSNIFITIQAEGEDEGDGENGISLISNEAEDQPVAVDGLRILFTADLRDHLLPSYMVDENGETQEYAGYARLASLINMNRTDNTIVLDGGNFSTGTSFHVLNAEKAPDLSILGSIGYDAVAIGDEEFHDGTQTLANMINVSENTPTVLTGNITCSSSETGKSLKTVLSTKGAATYKIIEKAGKKIGVFSVIKDGLVGSDDVSLEDAKKCAKEIVSTLKDSGADYIVALTHGGNTFAHEIAKEVKDIDVVIASCNVDAKEKTESEGDTTIVSCGENGQYLGVLDIDTNKMQVSGYQLVKSTGDIEVNSEINDRINEYKNEVNSVVFDGYGLDMDKTISLNDYDFEEVSHNSSKLINNNTADLITDAYAFAYEDWYEDWYDQWKEKKRQMLKAAQSLADKEAAENTIDGADENAEADPNATPEPTPETKVTKKVEEIQNMKPSVKTRAIGLISRKEIQDTFSKGSVTAQDAYNVVPYGTGADGSDGESLVLVFLKGSDIRGLCEYDATNGRNDDPENQLFFSGLKYTYNDYRQDYNHIEEVYVDAVNDYYIPVKNDELYPVVTTLTLAKELLNLSETTDGKFSVKYYDENGGRIQKLSANVLTYKKKELKSYKAISTYLSEMERNASGNASISQSYQKARNTKKQDKEFTLTGFFKNTTKNQIHKYCEYAGGVVFIIIVLKLLSIIIVRRKNKSEENDNE